MPVAKMETNMDAAPNEYVDDRYLAAHTPIARITWKTWRAKGSGPPYYQLGRRCLYKWVEVLAWIESKRTVPERERKAS